TIPALRRYRPILTITQAVTIRYLAKLASTYQSGGCTAASRQASQTAIDNLPCLHRCVGVDRIGKPTNGADLHQTKINGNRETFQSATVPSLGRQSTGSQGTVRSAYHFVEASQPGNFSFEKSEKRDMHCMGCLSCFSMSAGVPGFWESAMS
ncbi:hypothetical protein PoMZ_11361, partial [Pyricularia oryzae]